MAHSPAAPASAVTAPATVGLAARLAAWRVLQAVAAGAYADAALERELGRGSLSSQDRALATELAYGAIRQRLLLDAWIDALGKVPALRQPPRLRWLLHLGIYQLLFSERVPASAAVSTTVELAKQHKLARLAPVVNGLLRSLLRRRQEQGAGAGSDPCQGLVLPADPVEAFALRHSLPPWLAEELLGWLPLEAADRFGVACNVAPALDLRVNPLRSDRESLLAAFATAGVAAVALPQAAQGFTLCDRPGDLRALPGFTAGHWCVQDRSAQQIAPLLEARPGDCILDACAAPGGKSTQIAELIGDRGEVWAVDRSEARLRRVVATAERLGLTCIQPLAADATQLLELRPQWRGHFQRILVDAPCSGLGTLARHPDARWRIEPEAIEELAALQGQLLDALTPLLAPGGRIVYATCTVHPQENGGVTESFLADRPEWRLSAEHQWWPEAGGGDGFYAAVLDAP
ncbi:MAG: 16S rRNA (cytosine(967)-C(5))-methyltransferase [Cyanobacteriota bacterium]